MKTFRILVAIAVLALAGSASGQTVTTLYSFSGTDGAWPNALVQGSDGDFYGTTYYGGAGTNCYNGCGTIFKIDPSGTLTTLYSFGWSDGAYPVAGLVQGVDGNFYGTTQEGGKGPGTVFKVTANGSLTNLHNFTGVDGQGSLASLVQGTDGNFYGTAEYGGTSNLGVVFEITPSGSFTNLHSFSGADGRKPESWLVEGSDGNFYGTTESGGTDSTCSVGCGTVFRISPSGTLTNLHSIVDYTEGRYPVSGLVKGIDGNFYGVTSDGGPYPSWGAFFRISPSGTLTTLVGAAYGHSVFAPQALGSDGNLYGTDNSDAFRVSPSGAGKSLCYLGTPYSGLVQGSDGNFYGTTLYGGAYNSGSVFRISVPLSPPANQISGVQLAGSNVVFTIPSVAGETYQLRFATNLVSGNWSNVVGVCVSNSIGAALTVTNFGGATGPQGFYRFAITP